MGDFWQYFLKWVVILFAPIVLSTLSYWFLALAKSLRQQMKVTERALVVDIIQRAVLAAEQSGLAGYIENKGAEKREWAVYQIENMLTQQGISLDMDELLTLLEAEVHKQFGDKYLLDVLEALAGDLGPDGQEPGGEDPSD